MDILTEKVTETKNVNVYIAFDGEKFNSYRDCLDYERNIVFEALSQKVDELPDLKGLVPLTCDVNNITGSEFHWYHLKTPTNVDVCNEIFRHYGEEVTGTGIIAVEKTICKDIRIHYYEDCVRVAKDFFRHFDFDLKLDNSRTSK